ncbi:MAG: manganese efflux pump MntP family protein [Eubacteriales bacterium]|jgi:putative Mn2+ efflux pump MntP|nr:manganese efflux pump MntP family protein [Eubacteriales bacterium]
MGLADLIITAAALSMDAFAVALCKGLAMRRLNVGQAVITGLYFGTAQAVMPVLGYFLGAGFESSIKAYDHWIAFILLSLIGVKMISELFRGGDSCAANAAGDFGYRQMIPLSVATSIDALAVGVSFAFLGIDILPAAAFIGIITFTLSFAAVGIGCFFGSRFQKPAQLVGGIILVIMGVKILVEHLTAA